MHKAGLWVFGAASTVRGEGGGGDRHQAAKAQEVARELEVSRVFTDYKEMIADPALDAVIIASPDQHHREMVINTLEAGKHILCEKPLALTREDCEATFENVTPYDDTHIAIMKFPNHVIGKVFVSISCKRDYTMRSIFYGTKGTIIVDNVNPQMTVFKMDVLGDKDRHDMPITVPVEINNHNAVGEFKEFYDIIMEDKPISTDVFEGANTVAVCMAIMDSAYSGQIVKPDCFG